MTDVGFGDLAPNTAGAPIAFADGLEPLIKDSDVLSGRLSALAADVRITLAIATLAGQPIQAQRGLLTIENYSDFRPHPDMQELALRRAEEIGLKVIKVGRFGITVSGPADLISDLTGTPLFVQARQTSSKSAAAKNFSENYEPPSPGDLFLAPPRSLSVPANFSESIDHLVFTPPPIYFGPSPSPPPYTFHGVDAAKIRQLLNVPDDLDGSGIKVAMVDSGFFDHPYYVSKGYSYSAQATPSQPNPTIDGNGHGTAMAFNVFAVAPAVDLLGFKQTTPPQDALEDAADAGADIISCSWGYDHEQVFPVLQATLLDIVREGKIMLFAAGNGHYAWPGSQPEVLSIGGVYWNSSHNLEASNYASGFMSSLFPGRRVPDVCGLVGQVPRAIYIMMPTQPGCRMDVDNAGTPHPDHDETADNDGWVGASGTSAATPQIAGVVALMLQRARSLGRPLSGDRARTLLEQSAVAVTAGRNAMGFPAVGTPNAATGWGLVDTEAAIAQI